jgi:branched-chain amino acid transport system ATP-binding protein
MTDGTTSASATAASTSADVLLEVRDIAVHFGGIVALDGVSFDVPRGAILGLIGPNGAGKTTLFNCLSRLYIPNEGDIRFQGQSILSTSPHKIANIGIGRTFQNLALFATMSVLDNVMVGGHSQSSSDFVSNALRLPHVGREEKMLQEIAWELIEYLNLGDVAYTPVGGLPFGTQKRVEMARALAARPTLLLLDEPAGGLNHDEVEALGSLIKQIRDDRDITVLLVEHHMSLVMAVSDRVVAIDFGRKIGEGTPEEVQNNPDVIRAYLGTSD